jgi:hypothetical protein
MSIQNIIDKCQQIEIDKRRIVGQTISRSQRIKTAERSTAQPWRFKITPPGMLPWTASRGFIQVIDFNDRVGEYEISLNNNPGMNYITAYLGSFTSAQLNSMTIYSAGTSSFTLTNLPGGMPAGTIMFEPGDLIQPVNSRYPYTVASTATRGVNTTTSVTLHRPVITSENITLFGNQIKVGNSCTWRVVVAGLPTYQLVPMQRVQYTGDFELVEKVI